MKKSLKSWFTRILGRDTDTCQQLDQKTDSPTSSTENAKTEAIVQIIEAGRVLGWDTAVMIDKNHNPTGVFVAPYHAISDLQKIYDFENNDSYSKGETH